MTVGLLPRQTESAFSKQISGNKLVEKVVAKAQIIYNIVCFRSNKQTYIHNNNPNL